MKSVLISIRVVGNPGFTQLLQRLEILHHDWIIARCIIPPQAAFRAWPRAK
jgi:hypothetical protein